MSRGSPGAPPRTPGHGHRFSAMLFSLNVLSDSGKASDPEISPLISARCAGDTAVRRMAHPGLEPGLPLGLQRVLDPVLVTPIQDHGDACFILLSFPGVVQLGLWCRRGACMSWRFAGGMP